MVKDHQAVIKPDVAIRQFQVVDRAARQLRFDKILEVVAPIAKAAAERKGQVRLIQQFVTRHQPFQNPPRIAELHLRFWPGQGGVQFVFWQGKFTLDPNERIVKKGLAVDKRITRLR